MGDAALTSVRRRVRLAIPLGLSVAGVLAAQSPLHAIGALTCSTAERDAVVLEETFPEVDFGSPAPSDCSSTATLLRPDYDPDELWTIQVVVHVLMNDACTLGALSDAQVASQIDVMNEDFRALAGTPGAAGADAAIRFELATIDPEGESTTGITRDCNTSWYNDPSPCPYCATLAWDPTRYLNLYTNSAAGARGYVPFLPSQGGGQVGQPVDRVVINALAFGRPGPVPAHAGGRTVIHEVGHFLGLFHPYFNGCGTAAAPECYQTGDLVCDTAPDEFAHDVCPTGATSCGGVIAPIENYMELTDDSCLTGFTAEQVRRMRCTLMHYRPELYAVAGLFEDGFEGGDASAWSSVVSPLAPVRLNP